MNNFLSNLSKTPLWLFELVTTAKSFKGNPIIGSPVLNHFDSRTNPFNPLLGLGGEAINKIQYYFLDLYRKKTDENTAKRGGRSPWKLLENNGTSIEDR